MDVLLEYVLIFIYLFLILGSYKSVYLLILKFLIDTFVIRFYFYALW